MKKTSLSHFLALVRSALFILLVLLMAAPQGVKAQDSQTWTQATFTLKDLGVTSDDEYQGVLVSHQYGVTFPATWKIEAPLKITIDFSHSASLNNHSSMSVDWNDIRVGSGLLGSQNVEGGKLEIEIPAESVISGYNKLNVQFYMGIRDDFCEDFDNPAIWAVVHNTTSFEVQYSGQAQTLDLRSLPTTFIDPSPLQESVITLVLPANPSAAELEAAATISAKLGQWADWRTPVIKTLSLDKLASQKPEGNLLVIGQAANLATASTTLLPASSGSGSSLQLKDKAGKAIGADSGVLWLQTSPYDETGILLSVTGVDASGLQKASRAFATTSVFDRLSGQLGIILQTPAVEEVATTTPSLVYSLKSLGFADIVATGSSQQSTYLTLPLQLVFDSQGEAVFNLIFSHSTVLNPDRSSLDILVNDVPVTSIALNAQNAQDASVEVKIPLRLFKVGENSIAITSNLQVNNAAVASTLYCTEKYYTDSWLTISPNSTFTFPANIGQKTASLTGYPNLYLGSATLANLAFVVPDKIDWPVANLVLQVSNRIGHTARGDSLLPAVVSVKDQAAVSTARSYQIIVGLPAQNDAVMQLNDLLPQPFEADKVTPRAIAGVTQVVPASGSLGYIQSLFTEDGAYRLVLTGTSSTSLSWLASIVNTPDQYKKFSGNLVVASNAEETAFLTIASKTSLVSDQPVEADTTTAPNPGTLGSYPDWVLWLAGGIFVISLAALLVIRFTRNRK